MKKKATRISALVKGEADISKATFEEKKLVFNEIVNSIIEKHHPDSVTQKEEKDREATRKIKESEQNDKRTLESLDIYKNFAKSELSGNLHAVNNAWPEIVEKTTELFKLTKEKQRLLEEAKPAFETKAIGISHFVATLLMNPNAPANSDIKAEIETILTSMKPQIDGATPARLDEIITKILS